MSVWNYKDVSTSCTAANTWYCTGISLTVPKGQVYEIIVNDRYSSGDIQGIIVADNNSDIATASSIIGYNLVDTNLPAKPWVSPLHTMTPYYTNSDSLTYYVWIKRNGTQGGITSIAYRRIL